jgi:hypothetical protein
MFQSYRFCCIDTAGMVARSSRCEGGWASLRGRWRGCLRVYWRRVLEQDEGYKNIVAHRNKCPVFTPY